MNVIKKLIATAIGFLTLCLCGAAFAESSFERFVVSVETGLTDSTHSPLAVVEPYRVNEGASDTWKLRYVPDATGYVAFRIGGEGAGFAPNAPYRARYRDASGGYTTEPGILTLYTNTDGGITCVPEALLLMEFRQTSPAASDGVFSLLAEGTLTCGEQAASRYLQIAFVPERPSLDLTSGTEGVVFVPSVDADYECTLPAGTRSLNIRAALSKTIASTLTWRDAGTPSTLSFAHASDAIPFGKPTTPTNTVTFRSASAGTSVRVEVRLDCVPEVDGVPGGSGAPDGNGGMATLKKTLKITFGGSESSFVLSPTSLAGVVGTALSGTVATETTGARDVLSDLRVSPSSWNGLSLTVSGGKILVGGVPQARGEKTFVVTASVDGTPRAATFAVSISDSSASLVLSASKIDGHVDVPLTHTITATGANEADIVGTVSVTPTEWNGLNASVSGATITLSGTPALSGSGKFAVSAPVNGVVRSADFTVSVAINALSPLKLSPAAVAATVGKNLSETILTHSEASGDVIARVAVSPANWNGLTALVSDTKILLSGVPEGAGSRTFAVTAVVNAKECSATFRVDARAEGDDPEIPGTDTPPVSAMPEDWRAAWDEDTRSFTLSTALSLPVSSTNAPKALRAAAAASASAEFKYPEAVESVRASVTVGTFTVGGKVREGAKLNDVILDKISVTCADGTVYEQGNLALMLTQVLRDGGTNPSNPGTASDGGGGSGCNGGFGLPALVLIALPFLKKRR